MPVTEQVFGVKGFWRLYKKESNSRVSGICRATCWVLPAAARECFWSERQKGELYWNKFTVIFNSILAHWYVKSLICFYNSRANFTLVNHRNVLPFHPQWKVLFYSRSIFWESENKEWEEGCRSQRKTSVRHQEEWEDFLSSLGGRTDESRTKQALSKITSVVCLFQGHVTREVLFPLHAR